MRIGLDLDGVLVDWNNSFADLLGVLTGRPCDRTPPWPLTWDWPEAMGYTPDEVRKALEFVRENPDWWFFLPPTSDAVALMDSNQLHRLIDEHDVFVITSRVGAKGPSEAWLLAQFGLPMAVLDIMGPKGPLYDALQLDLAIDDKPEHLESAVRTERLILIDRPWNQREIDSRIVRMSLRDIVDDLVSPPLSRLIKAIPEDGFFA